MEVSRDTAIPRLTRRMASRREEGWRFDVTGLEGVFAVQRAGNSAVWECSSKMIRVDRVCPLYVNIAEGAMALTSRAIFSRAASVNDWE